MLFDATANGIVFLPSFLHGSLLVYRNATGFCMFFYPATLLNSLLVLRLFLVKSLRFAEYRNMLSVNRDHFTFPFLIWMPFFCCLIALRPSVLC